MKLLLFTLSTLTVFPVQAVDFYRCVDENGIAHFTNLPASSLNSNCEQQNDSFSVMLNEDYQNLSQEHEKYEISNVEDSTDFGELNDDNAALHMDINRDNGADASDEEEMKLFGAIKIPTKNIFDPDVAEEELFSTIEKRDDVITRAIRGRTKALETIIEATDTLKSHNNEAEKTLTQ